MNKSEILLFRFTVQYSNIQNRMSDDEEKLTPALSRAGEALLTKFNQNRDIVQYMFANNPKLMKIIEKRKDKISFHNKLKALLAFTENEMIIENFKTNYKVDITKKRYTSFSELFEEKYKTKLRENLKKINERIDMTSSETIPSKLETHVETDIFPKKNIMFKFSKRIDDITEDISFYDKSMRSFNLRSDEPPPAKKGRRGD